MNVDFLIYSDQSVIGGVTEYSQYETVTIIPQITGLEVGVQYTIQYTITDPDSIEYETVTYGFTSVTDLENVGHDVYLTKLGDWISNIIITRLDTGDYSTFEVVIPTSEFIIFEYNQCDSFIISNKSTTKDATMEITTLSGTSVLEPTAIVAGTSSTITLSAMGLYIVIINYTENGEDIQYKYILNTFCLIDDCLSKFIKDLLCDDTRDCTCEYDSSAEIKLIRMFALKETYFMKLQSEYGFNNKYSALTDSKLNELTTIDQILTKLASMCNRTYCLEGDCAGVASVTGVNVNTGCGCS